MKLKFIAVAVLLAASATGSWAGTAPGCAAGPGSNVTSNAIFGGGNQNGCYTIDRSSDGEIEVGLRGKLRYNLGGGPEDTFNQAGNMYIFNIAEGNPPPGRSIFNMEWSVNSNANGGGGANGRPALNVGDVTWDLRVNGAPVEYGSGGADPIAAGGDHAFGDNNTAQGDGTEAVDVPSYLNLIATKNLAQNSWNLGFGPAADPQALGVYTFTLSGSVMGNQIASTEIQVKVVPEIDAAAGMGSLAALGAMLAFARGRRRAVV